MSFATSIQPHQHAIRAAIESWATSRMPTLLALEPWGPDLQKRLPEYALRGKLIRGALVPFGWSLYREDLAPRAAYDAGVAMELLQSFLLIHDDIMDRDPIRRGKPAIHAQYETVTPAGGDAPWYGASMGICAGDVSAFAAIELLATLDIPAEMSRNLMALVAREIVTVGLAQMQDIHHGYIAEAGEEAILQVFTYKTGRYTFSLPLSFGARLAGIGGPELVRLERLGEILGRIFQIRDDRLGLFGSADEIGKPAGTDVRSDKKTLYRALFMARTEAGDPRRALFGQEVVTDDDLETVREGMQELGVVEEVDRIVDREAAAAEELIGELGCHPTGRGSLEDLLAFNLGRVS